jgi:hypothetical protein
MKREEDQMNFQRKKNGSSKNKVGRPKIYTDSWLANEAQVLETWLETKMDDDIIWFKAFALERGYHPVMLSKFAKQSDEFNLALKRVKALQEEKLVIGGLTGKLKPTFCIFLLKCVFGYNDRNGLRLEVFGNAEKPIVTKTETIKMDPPVLDDPDKVSKVLQILKENGALTTD